MRFTVRSLLPECVSPCISAWVGCVDWCDAVSCVQDHCTSEWCCDLQRNHMNIVFPRIYWTCHLGDIVMLSENCMLTFLYNNVSFVLLIYLTHVAGHIFYCIKLHILMHCIKWTEVGFQDFAMWLSRWWVMAQVFISPEIAIRINPWL